MINNLLRNRNRILLCVFTSNDFERTKYVLQTAVAQKNCDYKLLILGNKSNVSSYEELFEIINYGIEFSRCKLLLLEKNLSSFDYYIMALNEAKKNQFDYICILPPNVAFYCNESLEKLYKKSKKHGIYVGANHLIGLNRECGVFAEDFLSGPTIIPLKTNYIGSSITGQFDVSCLHVCSERGRICSSKKDRIEMCFLVSSYSIWSSLESLYVAASKNEQVDAKLVYVRSSHQNESLEKIHKEVNDFKLEGYDILTSDQYKIEERKPDIVIYNTPYSTREKGYNVDEVVKLGAKCIYIPYGMTINSNWKELVRLRYRIAMMYLAWMICYEDNSVAEFAKRNMWGDGKNVYITGSPRIDLIRKLNINSFPNYYDKIKGLAEGRKIVLWNTHHSIVSTDEITFSSWKKFGMGIIDYIRNRNDVFFIWRPHPYFNKALESYMGTEQYQQFIIEVSAIENLYVDNEKTYLASFSVSDIFISDASTMAKEYLFMDKPVIVTVSDKRIIEPMDALYICEAFTEFKNCLNLLVEGNDYKDSIRKEYISSILGDNNTVGDALLNQIIEKYYNEYE